MKSKLFLTALVSASLLMLATANANDVNSELRLVNKNFYGVVLYGNANVYVLQSDVNSVKVVGSKKNVAEVTTKIINGSLVINSGELRNVDVYVTLNEITHLHVVGNGLIRVASTINSDLLQLKVTGNGQIIADVRTLGLAMVINGSGKIYIGGITGDSYVKIKGNGQIIDMDFDSLNAVRVANSTFSTDSMFNHRAPLLNN